MCQEEDQHIELYRQLAAGVAHSHCNENLFIVSVKISIHLSYVGKQIKAG
jgi:hypothetical protein